MPQFSNEDLQLLDETAEVDVETQRRDGTTRVTTTWNMVDGGGASGLPRAGDKSWSIRAEPVSDEGDIQRVSQAIERKYVPRWPVPGAAMLRPGVLPTTMRLAPAN